MVNLQASKDMLDSILKDLSSEIVNQVRAKRGNQAAIQNLLNQIDETIMFEVGNMVNTNEQADKEAIQDWIENANQKSREMLDRYKGRNSSVDKILNNSKRTFNRNQSNTVLKEMKQVEEDNKEENAGNNGAYKREDFKTRYEKNENAIKKAQEMAKKRETFDSIKGGRSNSQIIDDFTQIVGKDAASDEFYGVWKERTENLQELENYDFRSEMKTLQRRLSTTTSDVITPTLTNSFKTLQDKLSKIDFDASYNSSLNATTKQKYEDILAIDRNLKGVSKDDLRKVINAIVPDDINRLERDVQEISNPNDLKNTINTNLLHEIQTNNLFELFPEDRDKIEEIVNDNRKNSSEKSTALEAIFKEERKALTEVMNTSVEAEKRKLTEARLRKRDLDQEKVQEESYEAAEKEYNEFKDVKEMAETELGNLSTEVGDLKEEVDNLYEDAYASREQFIRLSEELAYDDEARRQLAEAQAARQAAVDPTKLDLEDLGFSKEFQLKDERGSGFVTKNYNFVEEDLTARDGRRGDGDNLVDKIYKQLKADSNFASVAEKLEELDSNSLEEVRHPRLSKIWARVRSIVPILKNRPSNREKDVERALKQEIEKRIQTLRHDYENPTNAPVPDIDIMSEQDRLELERAYEAQREITIDKVQRHNEKKEEYNRKNDDLVEQATIYDRDIKDKYTTRKQAFEDSLKVKVENDGKYQSNVNRAIYETVRNGQRVNPKDVKEEAEGMDRED